MKHLFEIDQVVFVVATDTVQLSHSVGAVYGGGFNSDGYLSRFFNRTYYFERVSRRDFIEDLFTRLPIEADKVSLPPHIDLTTYLTGGFDFFGLSLRDIEQVYDILRSVATGAVAELVGIEVGVVSGVINLESSGVEASDWRPRHDEHYLEV